MGPRLVRQILVGKTYRGRGYIGPVPGGNLAGLILEKGKVMWPVMVRKKHVGTGILAPRPDRTDQTDMFHPCRWALTRGVCPGWHNVPWEIVNCPLP